MRITPKRFQGRVTAIRALSDSGYELTFTREGLEFRAGQILTLHGSEPMQDRSYTIASGENDEHLQVLFRLIPDGKLTPTLAALEPGDPLHFSGPFGEFVVRDPAKPIVFVATGTGVAPCRAYLRTHKGLDLTLIHGTRIAADLFYRDEFAQLAYHPCVTRETGAGFNGRVTTFMESWPIEENAQFHLCGANEMIFDMQILLKSRGVDECRVFTEAYYYRLHS